MTETTTERPALLANFAQREKDLAASGPDWLRGLRREALARFEHLGLPTSRMEEWKSTPLGPLTSTSFVPAAPGDAIEPTAAGSGAIALGPERLVFVNGRHASGLSKLSLPDGVWAGSLREGLQSHSALVEAHLSRLAKTGDDRAFTALNTALFEDGALIVVPDGVRVEQPIQLLHFSAPGGAPTASHARTLVVAGKASRVAVVETFCGGGDEAYLTNAVTEFFVDDDAEGVHYRIQHETPAAFHVGSLHSRQARNSRFTAHNFDLGASLTRLDSIAVLDGEGSECTLNGLYMTSGRQHADNHTTLDHAKPHCSSRELYKGILAGGSRAVFNGRIIVREDAQKTDAKQSNPNLLLSDSALVHTRPQLEIYADDVRCTHGATIGRLDGEARFYLRSRGIGEQEAGRMLVRAFAGEVLGRVEIEPLRQALEREVAQRLERAG